MMFVRSGVSQHLRACPTYVDRCAIPIRPHARRIQQRQVSLASQKPPASGSGDDEVDDIRKQLEAFSLDGNPAGDSETSSFKRNDRNPSGSSPIPFKEENLEGESGYSTRAIPPSMMSGSTEEPPTSAAESRNSLSKSAPSPDPTEPSQSTAPPLASVDLDQPDTRSVGMDFAAEFSKIAAARQSNNPSKERRDIPLTSNDILSILAADMKSPGGSSDGAGSGTDDDFFMDLATGGNTSDDEGRSISDTLAEVVSMEVRKQQFKEGFLTELEGKKDNLRSIGEQIKDELAARLEIDKMRAELASSVAMSDTMEKFDALEAEIRAIQEQLKADEEDLQAFEERNAEDRSKGLFFKGLYVAPKKKKPDSGTSSNAPGTSNQAEANGFSETAGGSKAAVTEFTDKLSTIQPLNSLRLYFFASLAAGCCAVVAADMATGDPSVGSDVLFGGLAALLVLTAVQEQKGPRKRRSDGTGGVNSYDGRDKGSRRR